MTKQTMGAGDLLVRIGAVLFLVGAAGTVATVAPLLLGTSRLPTPAYFVSMLMGVGLAVALAGLLRAALAQRGIAAGAAGAAGADGAGGARGAAGAVAAGADGAGGARGAAGAAGSGSGAGTDARAGSGAGGAGQAAVSER